MPRHSTVIIMTPRLIFVRSTSDYSRTFVALSNSMFLLSRYRCMRTTSNITVVPRVTHAKPCESHPPSLRYLKSRTRISAVKAPKCVKYIQRLVVKCPIKSSHCSRVYYPTFPMP
ncbi:unnamed protein product [Periconia digitata]|uniref:Uncharacterized protein n=1 Tax=Periconia digitata TaxID=1303443 RepID=A0A9W4XHV4_9PLEO|nr:unnamed protein product [Periconia digitata]